MSISRGKTSGSNGLGGSDLLAPLTESKTRSWSPARATE